MKAKTLIVLFLILGILAVAGALIVRMKAPERAEKRLGIYLLEELPANKVVSISIRDHEHAVSLTKKKDVWVVTDRFGYPADFSRIIELVRKMKEAKIGRTFDSSHETRKRLSLKEPEDDQAKENEKGTRIRLKGKKEEAFANILLGQFRLRKGERSIPDGQYVMVGQDPKIYLIDKLFRSVDGNPAAWLDKDLVKAPANEVKRIACLSADGKAVVYALERPQKDKDFEAKTFPADSKVRKTAVSRVAGALSSLPITDVESPSTPPASIGLEMPRKLEYHLFNGMIYRIYPSKTCQGDDRCHLKLEVDYAEPPARGKEDGKIESLEKGEAKVGKSPEEYAREAEQLNERLSPWVYVVPKWKHGAFITDLGQLIEQPAGAKPDKEG